MSTIISNDNDNDIDIIDTTCIDITEAMPVTIVMATRVKPIYLHTNINTTEPILIQREHRMTMINRTISVFGIILFLFFFIIIVVVIISG